MVEYDLFFGFSLDKDILRLLDHAPDNLKKIYISEGSEYLQEKAYQNHRFLGKVLGSRVRIENLSLLQKNITSLVEKISPEFQNETLAFSIFPVRKIN